MQIWWFVRIRWKICVIEALFSLKPPLVGSFETKNLSCSALVREHPEPPLCKGRWHGKAVTEGLCSRVLCIARTFRRNRTAVINPSVSFADSSLYTREPLAGANLVACAPSLPPPCHCALVTDVYYGGNP